MGGQLLNFLRQHAPDLIAKLTSGAQAAGKTAVGMAGRGAEAVGEGMQVAKQVPKAAAGIAAPAAGAGYMAGASGAPSEEEALMEFLKRQGQYE